MSRGKIKTAQKRQKSARYFYGSKDIIFLMSFFGLLMSIFSSEDVILCVERCHFVCLRKLRWGSKNVILGFLKHNFSGLKTSSSGS